MWRAIKRSEKKAFSASERKTGWRVRRILTAFKKNLPNLNSTNMYNFKKFRNIGLITLAMLCCVSCGEKKEKPTQVKSNGLPQAASTTGSIAFIDVDSLMSRYEFSKEFTLKMSKKRDDYAATINKKGQALQNAAAEFQRKMQQGEYTSQEQAVKAQNSLQRQQEELQKLQEDLATKFDNEQQAFNEALRDSINNFLLDYNKARKFSMILSKAGDNILYADKSLDITNDVITGLNKRYKKK